MKRLVFVCWLERKKYTAIFNYEGDNGGKIAYTTPSCESSDQAISTAKNVAQKLGIEIGDPKLIGMKG